MNRVFFIILLVAFLAVPLSINNVNDDGSLNRKSRHAGLPVIKGEKWAFNLWLRER